MLFFFLQQISKRVCCQLDLSDIQSCRLRSLFDWHHAEHHSASVFPQVTHLIMPFLKKKSNFLCCYLISVVEHLNVVEA